MQYAGEAGLRGPAGGKRGGARLGGRGPGADPLDEDKVSRTGESGPPPSAKPSDPRSTAALFAGGRVPPGISTGTSVPPEHPAAAHRATRRPECRHRRDLRHADGYVPTPAGDLPESIHPPAQGPGDPRALSDPRGRPYFVFWTSPHDDTLTRVLRMESVQQGTAVQLTMA